MLSICGMLNEQSSRVLTSDSLASDSVIINFVGLERPESITILANVERSYGDVSDFLC